MKQILFIPIIFLLMVFSSCEEVVDVDLDNAEPKLVIDAYIKWKKGTAGNEQEIRLSMTAPYFSENVPAVSGAVVTVANSTGTIFNFTEETGTGIYRCNDFIPVLNDEYFLTVFYDGQTYSASEILKPAPDITLIEQNNEGGFTGEEIEVRAFFTDNGATDDFYLFRFDPEYYAIPYYEVVEDRFFNGNQIFALYSDEDMASGDELKISIFGISERYYNYMNILTSISGGNGGSPFQSPPATVRGNIVNTTNQSDYPLGFFAISEVDEETYLVE